MTTANSLSYAAPELCDRMTPALRRLAILALTLSGGVLAAKLVTLDQTACSCTQPECSYHRLANRITAAVLKVIDAAYIGPLSWVDAAAIVVSSAVFGVVIWRRFRRRGPLPGNALVLAIAGVALILSVVNLKVDWRIWETAGQYVL